MMTFEEWNLVMSENLGSRPLGMAQSQNLGLKNDSPAPPSDEDEEGGDDMGGDDEELEDDDLDGDDDGDEDEDGEDGDGEDGENLDPDAEFDGDDSEGDSLDGEKGESDVMKKKPVIGKPYDDAAFMKSESSEKDKFVKAMKDMFGNPWKKNFSGLKEDIVLDEKKPVATPVNDSTNESVKHGKVTKGVKDLKSGMKKMCFGKKDRKEMCEAFLSELSKTGVKVGKKLF